MMEYTLNKGSRRFVVLRIRLFFVYLKWVYLIDLLMQEILKYVKKGVTLVLQTNFHDKTMISLFLATKAERNRPWNIFAKLQITFWWLKHSYFTLRINKSNIQYLSPFTATLRSFWFNALESTGMNQSFFFFVYKLCARIRILQLR